MTLVAAFDEFHAHFAGCFQRSVTDPTERKHFLSNAPADPPLSVLVQVAAARHHIEELLEEVRSEVGLAEYEVRY